MKNKLKMFAGLALAMLALSVCPVKAHAVASSTETAANINKFPTANVGVHDKLDFYGLKVKVITQTSTSSLLHTGAGFLDAICPYEGTLGKYSAAFDTAGEQVAGNIFVAANSSYRLSPNVYTNTDTTSADANKGCWFPPAPIKYATGLYGGQNDSGHTTLYYVHCSDGDNPCLP